MVTHTSQSSGSPVTCGFEVLTSTQNSSLPSRIPSSTMLMLTHTSVEPARSVAVMLVASKSTSAFGKKKNNVS